MAAVRAEPLQLLYGAETYYLSTIDIFSGPRKGLSLWAYEVCTGRRVLITIGNATFVVEVRGAGRAYGGYARFNGDLQVVNGDPSLEGRAFGQTLYQRRVDYSQEQPEEQLRLAE